MPVSRKDPKFGYLVAATYGLVIFTTVIAIGAYYYLSSRQDQTGSSLDETGAGRTLPVGDVWVNVYPGARMRPADTRLSGEDGKQIVEGVMEFTSADPPGQVLEFYRTQLARVGYLVSDGGDANAEESRGGSMQAVRLGGRIRVLVSAVPGEGGEVTAGLIRTFAEQDENSR